MGRSCSRQQISFQTAEGEVEFTGRPGGSKECPPRETTPGEECSREVFAKAVEYCRLTSKSKDKILQQKVCLGRTIRMMASAVKCSKVDR